MGYAYVGVTNMTDGLRLTHEIRPSLIVMDIYLPGEGDGCLATEYIKRHDKLKHIPVIMFTAHDDQDKAFAAGCEAYFRKPINVNAFMRCIRSYLN